MVEENEDFESIKRQKGVLEKLITNVPTMIVGADLQGNIAIFNKEAERVTGYVAEDVVGQSFLSTLVTEEEHQDTVGIFHISNESGPLHEIQRHMRTKDGEKRLISWACSPMNDVDGTMIGIIFTGSDATENEVMESLGELATLVPETQEPQQLTSSGVITEDDATLLDAIKADMEWQAAFNSIADPIAIISKENLILRINTAYAKIIDSNPDELVGKKCCEVFHDENSPIHNCLHKKILETEKEYSEEIENPDTGKPTLISCFPYHDDEGEFIGSIVIARELHERKIPDADLKEPKPNRIRELDQLISAIAHEINNPLGGVLGYAEALGNEDDPLKIRFYSKEIKDGASRVSDILTSFRKFYLDQREMNMQSLNLNNIIESSLKFMKDQNKFDNMEIALNLSQIPDIQGISNEIQQVLIYLLTNSVDAMKGNGKINILTKMENGNAQLIFGDEGQDVPKEHIAWIFDPSAQDGIKESDVIYKNMERGLRIYAVKSILRKHNAPINIETKPGVGRKFTINFPVAES